MVAFGAPRPSTDTGLGCLCVLFERSWFEFAYSKANRFFEINEPLRILRNCLQLKRYMNKKYIYYIVTCKSIPQTCSYTNVGHYREGCVRSAISRANYWIYEAIMWAVKNRMEMFIGISGLIIHVHQLRWQWGIFLTFSWQNESWFYSDMIDTYDCWPTLTRSYDYKSIHLAGSLFMNTHFLSLLV